MNNRLVMGMMAGVVVLLIAAAVLLGGKGTSGDRELLCAELEDHINDVQSVVIESSRGLVTYERDSNGHWSAREQGGYAANGDKIGTLLIALRDAEKLEPKSKKPENWSKLGVADPGEGSTSARIEVRGPGDAVYANVIVGTTPSRSAEAAQYVREAGSDTPWLASGSLRLPKQLRDWLDTSILNIAPTRIASVQIERPDGASYLMQKSEEERAQLVPSEIPEGKELQSEYVTSRFSSALSSLTFDGVKSAAATEFPATEAVVTRFWTRHGLLVTVESVEVEDELWARIRASYDEAAPVLRTLPEVPEIEGDDAGDLLGDDPEPPPGPPEPTPEEVQTEVAALNETVEPWIYVLPSHKKQSLRTELDELLKDVPPPPPAEEDSGDDDAGADTDQADDEADEDGGR